MSSYHVHLQMISSEEISTCHLPSPRKKVPSSELKFQLVRKCKAAQWKAKPGQALRAPRSASASLLLSFCGSGCSVVGLSRQDLGKKAGVVPLARQRSGLGNCLSSRFGVVTRNLKVVKSRKGLQVGGADSPKRRR